MSALETLMLTRALSAQRTLNHKEEPMEDITVIIARVETPHGRRWSLWDSTSEVLGLKSWTKARLLEDRKWAWTRKNVTVKEVRGILTPSEWALTLAEAQGAYVPWKSYVLPLDVRSEST